MCVHVHFLTHEIISIGSNYCNFGVVMTINDDFTVSTGTLM